jgi:phosphomannomutase
MTDWVAKAKQYVSWDPNAETRAEIQKDIDNNDVKALEAKLGERLEFGTAGLRGPMGAGYNKMNDLVVIQSTQGVCKYLLQCFGDKAKEMGFVVGYVDYFR